MSRNRPPTVFIGLPVLTPTDKSLEPIDEMAGKAVAELYRQLSTPEAIQKLQPRGPVVIVPKGRRIQTPGLATKARHRTKKIGRNDPCPCRSGEKFKNCHGRGGRTSAVIPIRRQR